MSTPVYTDPHRQVPASTVDPEQVIGGYLRYELGGDYTVCTDVRGLEPFAVPVIRVNTVGGSKHPNLPALILDRVLIEVDVFGADQTATETAVRRARALMLASKGVMYLGVVITKVEELDGPSSRPEPDPKLNRIGFSHEVSIHPA